MADIKSLLEDYDRLYGDNQQDTNSVESNDDLSAYLDKFAKNKKQQPTKPNKFNLRQVLSSIKSGATDVVTNPVETIKSLVRGTEAGTLETVGNIGLIEQALLKKVGQVMPEGLRNILDLNETGQKRGNELVNKLFAKAKQLEEESARSGEGQKFVHNVAEFIPATLGIEASGIPTIAEGSQVISKLPQVLKAGGRLAAETQLIYNPDKERENRIQSAASNFLAGMAFHLAPEVIKEVVKPITRPMKKLSDAIFNKFSQSLSEDIYNKALPAILGAEDKSKITVPKDVMSDVIEVLKGQKPITSKTRLFFSSPEWKDVVKKYGIDLSKYPDELTIEKPAISVINPGKIAGLLPSGKAITNFANDITELVSNLADTQDFETQKQIGTNILNNLDIIRSLGYDIPETDFLKLIKKGVDYARRYNESMALILKTEVDKNTLETLKNSGNMDLLGLANRIRKTYNLFSGRINEPVLQIIKSFEKKKEFEGWDAVREYLESTGVVPPDTLNSPSDIVNFFLDLPTKKELAERIKYAKEIQPKEKLDIRKEILELLKPKRNIEQPRLVIRETLQDEVNRKIERSQLPVNVNAMLDSTTKIVSDTVNDNLKTVTNNFLNDSGIVWYKVANENIPIEEIAPTMERYAKSLLEQIETISTLPKEEAELNSNLIVNGIDTLQNFLYKTPFIESLFSAQNKATYRETSRVGSMLLLMERALEPIRIIQQRVDRDLNKLLRPETKLIFNKIIEEEKYDGLTENELRAVKIWKSYAKSIYNFLNVLREAAGRKPLPKVENYFPRQLADILKEDVEQFTKDTNDLINVDSSFYLKRTLDSITILHEKDINKILPTYHKSILFYTDYLLRSITKNSVKRWDKEEYSAFVNRLRQIGYFPSIEKEYEQLMTKSTQWIAKNAKDFFDKVTLGKFQQKVKIPDELKDALRNSSLADEPAIREFLEKDYIDLSRNKWEKLAVTLTSMPVYLSSTLKLIWNIPFTLLNMIQAPTMALRTFGASATPSVIKGYLQGTLLPLIFKITNSEYASDEKALLKSLGYLSARFGSYGEGVTLLDNLGKFGDFLTANITITEKAQRLSALMITKDILKKIPDLTDEQRLRIAAEFSAYFNFIGGKYANPSIKSSMIGKAAYQFMQYPLSSMALSLEMYKKIASDDPVAKQLFLNIVRSIGDKNAYNAIKNNIDKLTPTQLDNLMGLIIAAGLTYGTIISTFNIFNLAAGFLNGQKAFITTKRAKQEALQTIVPPLAAAQRFLNGGVTISESYSKSSFQLPGTPAITMIMSVPKLGEAAGQFINGLINDNVLEMDKAVKNINDATLTILPTFIARLQDVIDASKKGVVYNTKEPTKVQYKLSKKPVESPLTLLFGRSSLKEYEKYGKARKHLTNRQELNQEASDAFIKAIIEKNPKKKRKYLMLYNKLVKKGAKRVKMNNVLRTIRKRRRTTALERMLSGISKRDRLTILKELNK